jgi:hypothetical protein
MSVVGQLATVLEPWQSIYADSTLISTSITALHVVALVVGGGIAIATDRMTLRVRAGTAEQQENHARELAAVHRPVLVGLVVIIVSGLLMAAADVEVFLTSPVFWIKMTLVVLLLVNGLVMQRSASRLTASARVSVTLWALITILGVVLAGT